MSAQNAKAVEAYLEELRSALSDLPHPGVEELIRELRVHLADSAADNPEADIDLARLGEVSEIAAEYRMQSSVARIAGGRYPWEMLRGAFQWSRAGVLGTAMFLLALTGYLTAIVCLICGTLKVFYPDAIGLWTAGTRVMLGLLRAKGSAYEVVGVTVGLWPPSFVVGVGGGMELRPMELMGWWLIPAALAAGLATAILVTSFIRRVAIEFSRRQGSRRRFRD